MSEKSRSPVPVVQFACSRRISLCPDFTTLVFSFFFSFFPFTVVCVCVCVCVCSTTIDCHTVERDCQLVCLFLLLKGFRSSSLVFSTKSSSLAFSHASSSIDRVCCRADVIRLRSIFRISIESKRFKVDCRERKTAQLKPHQTVILVAATCRIQINRLRVRD